MSSERRQAAGVTAGETYDVGIELDTEPRQLEVAGRPGRGAK